MKRYPLNDGWYFTPGFDPRLPQLEKPESEFESVRLPHTVRLLPFNDFSEQDYQMVSGYLRFFTPPESWQGRRVLGTILRGVPFSAENAVSLRRAAVCSFVVSGAALARLVFSVWYFRSPQPLLSYNALFVPIFAMAGLLCLVMSALFRQAAEMKAENDLTI